MPREFYSESHCRSQLGGGARGFLHRNNTTSTRERAHPTIPEHQDIQQDENDIVTRAAYYARPARASLLRISRTERRYQGERRRINELMQHLTETGQRSYMAEHDELHQRDRHRQQISLADGYEAGFAAARRTSLEENTPSSNGRSSISYTRYPRGGSLQLFLSSIP